MNKNEPDFPDIKYLDGDGIRKYDYLRTSIPDLISDDNALMSHVTPQEYFSKYNDYLPKSLFKYRKINDYSFCEIFKQQIYFSDIDKVNDPIDSRYVEYLLKKRNLNNDDIIAALYLLKRKISCFTTAYDNYLMWSHYANNHKGVCIEYDYFKLMNNEKSQAFPVFPILYTNCFNQVNIIRKGPIPVHLITLANLCKSKCWSYEDEWRFTISDSYYKFLNKEKYLNIPIKAIYFGCQCTAEYISQCELLMKNEIVSYAKSNNISLFQLHIKDFPINNKPLTFSIEDIYNAS